jgi:WS/DGAT/MGAT family acyltransferase
LRKLSVLDLAFFVAESEGSPKHVAGLSLYKKPAGCHEDFALDLFEEMRTHDRPTEPFNLVIHFLGLKGPHWRACENFCIEDHLFYHRQKKAVSWDEVKALAARLHEPIMDRSKPLWECHLIDGIRGRKFAVYAKFHHAYADGMTMTSWLGKTLSESRDDMSLRPMWTQDPPSRPARKEQAASLGKTLQGLTRQGWGQILATGGIAKIATQQYLERIGLTHNAVSIPFSASGETPLTGSASPGRRLATAFVPMNRVRRICKATRSTLNHVALTCIDGALHRYLADEGVFLDHPITIQMPVNLRSENDETSGNKLGIVLVDLANPTDDPFVRLREIGFTLRNVRNQIDGVPGTAIEQYSILSAVLGEMIEKLKLSDKLPANGHTLVSNVPGPVNPLYLKGAKLEQMYPISTLAPGLHMNITLFSYAGKLHFGIVSTRDMKRVDRLAQYVEEAFTQLEEAVFEKA